MDYLFLHVPKTAGTSLWSAFVGLFGEENVSDPIGSDETMTAKQAASLRHHRMISGHLCRAEIAGHFDDRQWLTVIRHPVDREISSYYFHAALDTPNMANQMSVDDFFFRTHDDSRRMRELWNRQVRQLGGRTREPYLDLRTALKVAKETLRRCVWFGIHDRLADDVSRLRNLPDFSELPALPQERVTAKRPSVADISPRLRQRILDTHPYDLELYHWACEYSGGQSGIASV